MLQPPALFVLLLLLLRSLQLNDSSVRSHGMNIWSGSALIALWLAVLIVTVVLGTSLASPPAPLQWWQVGDMLHYILLLYSQALTVTNAYLTVSQSSTVQCSTASRTVKIIARFLACSWRMHAATILPRCDTAHHQASLVTYKRDTRKPGVVTALEACACVGVYKLMVCSGLHAGVLPHRLHHLWWRPGGAANAVQ